jgi:hypothetical protein
MQEDSEPFKKSPTFAQHALCKKYSAGFCHADPDLMIGVADNIYEHDLLPINGLRHPIEGQNTGWFIWRGETLSTRDDFFKPYHVRHIHQICPEIMEYLGLAPGWRFVIAPGYEDVWYDESLLDAESDE